MLFVSKVTGECTRILAAGDQIPRGTGFREIVEEHELDETHPWDEFLTAAAFAIRSTHHTTLQASPAQPY